ncbi:MAG: S-layer homology domain-containing protein, partial [Armatimonadetes bacterium]|nr:S-layer homology domain-containing protein [Armatimonadota bacterium]
DQMAVYMARAICEPTGDEGLVGYVPADPRNFPDVPSSHWAYTYVEYCVEQGVVGGYLDGTYRPEVVVTRDQMAVYIARAFGLPM